MTAAARIDFATLKRPSSPNTYLAAPEGLCKAAKVDKVPPVFGANPAQLRQALLGIVVALPRTSHTFADERVLYDDFVVRSAWFGFPDLVSVQALPAKGGATLAIYSRSVYGRSDMGVNGQRVRAWLRRLEDTVGPVKG